MMVLVQEILNKLSLLKILIRFLTILFGILIFRLNQIWGLVWVENLKRTGMITEELSQCQIILFIRGQLIVWILDPIRFLKLGRTVIKMIVGFLRHNFLLYLLFRFFDLEERGSLKIIKIGDFSIFQCRIFNFMLIKEHMNIIFVHFFFIGRRVLIAFLLSMLAWW